MDQIVIEGGIPLHGTVQISGSKNAALPCLFASLLTDQDCILKNVPDLVDIDTTCSLLAMLGKKISRNGNEVRVSGRNQLHTEAPYNLVKKMRASVLVLGPLIVRRGEASASLPGGCAIGNRPINIHLAGLEKLGAKTRIADGVVHLKADHLTGQRIAFDFPSVGATENVLMASVLARGKTTIENAAREPEIVDLADCLNRMGAQISGAGSRKIVIHGKEKLHGAAHPVIPDRVESATYLIAAAATGGTVNVEGACSRHLGSVLNALRRAGAKLKIQRGASGLDSIACAAAKKIKPVSVKTGVFPAFPTDVQAQWMALMSLARGKSTIEETIFENRFVHAAELVRMGAKITVKNRRARVEGVGGLSGTHVMVSDLRAGAAMIIAGLAAGGKTTVQRIYHLDRGYESLEKKFSMLGARIQRIQN